MPKKPAHNSYYFFMVEFRKLEEEKGRRFPNGLKEVSQETDALWRSMPAHARAKYEAQAKAYKNQGGHARKYTAQGECLDDVKQREDEETRARKDEYTDINRIVSSGLATKALLQKDFLLIDVNFYCETYDRFVINEVSLLTFKMAEGLGEFYHKIVDPGCIPTGFASDAKFSFEEHNFPLPPLGLKNCEGDHVKILAEIMDYLKDYRVSNNSLPPLFTMPDKVAPVKSFLQQLCDYCAEDASIFRVYQLHTLFYCLTGALKNAANEGLPTEALALTQLKRDPFRYHLHLACDFHEETEVNYNCTLSRVKRWAFTVLDHCCPLANLDMVPGCHLPAEVDVEVVAQVKEWHEEDARKAKESQKPFQFINYAEVPQRKLVPVAAPVAAPAAIYAESDFPSLGGGTSKGAVSKRPALRLPDGSQMASGGSFGCFGRGRGTGSAWGPKK